MTVLTGRNITAKIMRTLGIKDPNDVVSFTLKARADDIVRLEVERLPDLDKDTVLEFFKLCYVEPDDKQD